LHHHLRTKTHKERIKKIKKLTKVEHFIVDKFSQDIKKKKLKRVKSFDTISMDTDITDEKTDSKLRMKNNRKRCMKLRYRILTR
jgi:hypothetical protein